MHRFVTLGNRAWSTAWKEFCAAHFPNLNPLDFREHLLKRVKDSQHTFTTFAESLRKENESLSGTGEQATERELKKVLTKNFPGDRPLPIMPNSRAWSHPSVTLEELARVLDLANSADATRGVSRLDNLELKLDKVLSLVADNKNPARNPRRESHPLDADPYNDYDPMEAYNVAPTTGPSSAPPRPRCHKPNPDSQ
ncbi:hypothetical protein HK102_005803, partial [Quaeritorhiza haematococci]